jgi:hypothetical protein
MAALAGNFHVLGSGFFAELAAVFLARLHHATAWQVGTLLLVVGHDSFSSSSFQLSYQGQSASHRHDNTEMPWTSAMVRKNACHS